MNSVPVPLNGEPASANVRVSDATLNDPVAAAVAARLAGSLGARSRESDAFAATAGPTAVTQDSGPGHLIGVLLRRADGGGDNDLLGAHKAWEA